MQEMARTFIIRSMLSSPGYDYTFGNNFTIFTCVYTHLIFWKFLPY